MNANVGGPVGGPMPPQGGSQELLQLHTYIYDHLLKLKHYDLARNFLSKCEIMKKEPGKDQSNGANASKNGLDTKPSDLPEAGVPDHPGDNSFLQEWWATFWDFYAAARRRNSTPMMQ